ncbi:S9 family peptidase [bacterium]|nr:MAG: S9 family peptidase [bacterium]
MSSSQTQPDSSSSTSLIGRSLFFGNPSRRNAQISPDGTFISFLAPIDGVMNIWVGSFEDWQSAKAMTFDKGRGIANYQWSKSGNHIIYLQDSGGDENWLLYSLEIATGNVRCLTPFADSRVGFYKLSYDFPDDCVFGLNARNKQFSDVWKVNIVTGKLTFVLQNDEYGEIVVDKAFAVRVASKNSPDGGIQYYKREGDEWTPLFKLAPEDALSTGVIGVSETGSILAASSRGRDTSALVWINPADGSEEVLGMSPAADIADCFLDPITERLLAYSTNRLKRQWNVLEEDWVADFELLSALPGSFSVVSLSRDSRKAIIVNEQANHAGAYKILDRDQKQLTDLFTIRPELDGLNLREMHPVEIPARDGLPLVSYYTLPFAADPTGSGQPSQPSPMILLVHGGPWARDEYGFHPFHQWLANRGYAVLSVNYRGSTGFGKNFINAANHQFAGAMHDDLIDAVDWAIAQGITSRDTVAIFGGSYGGYATLVGLTFTPDRFAAGVDLVGPSSLVSLIESFPAYWKPLLESSWFSRVGNPELPDDRERLLAQSPITRVKHIRVPLLIGQGANDPRVVQAESDQMVQVMEEAGLPVAYVLYPDEGHGFVRPENKMAFYSIMESFLGQIFGLPSEPIGDNLQGSSTLVPNGTSLIPGLDEALKTHQPVVKQ